MKKILLITSILFFAFSLSTVKAQTIDTVIITTPILCYGDFAAIEVQTTQTVPPTPLNYVLEYSNTGAIYFQIAIAPLPPATTVGTVQPFTLLVAGFYRIKLKDANGVVLDSYDIYIPQPFPLSATAHQTDYNLCNGDCTAKDSIAISGGTHPYTLTLNGQTVTLGDLSSDTTYENLCADTYNLTFVDSNGCPGSVTFTITEPPELIPNGSNLLYNGQDISCFGEDDGVITAVVTGGTPTYTYSIDGVTFSTNPVFPGLVAGTYTIYYLDANGCDTSETFTLTDPPDLSGALTITQQVSCNGVSDGVITFIVNNINIGTPGYQYSIDGGATFQTDSFFTGLTGGLTHTILVEDVNGCQFSASIFLSEPTAIVFSTSSSDFNGFGVSCNGASDGWIQIFSPSGGTPNYDYSIDGGNNYSTTMLHNGLSAGTYLVMVRDASGCTNDTTIIITEPLLFSITATATSLVSCFGDCDGEIEVTWLNGVGVITYNMVSFPPSQTTTVWGSLCAGSYIINAIDDNGCPATTAITLIEPDPWVYTVDSTEETCGLVNGIASINVTSGGSGPGTYAYLWDDPVPQQITATATGLEEGMYEVRVTDANGCTFTEDVYVGEADITLAFVITAPCNAPNDGSATVIADGVPPYIYWWFDSNGVLIPGQTGTSITITGLLPGWYSVDVTDSTGCQVTDSVEIPASNLIDVILDSTNSMLSVDCNGFQSSGITVIATGGTGPNTYLYHIPNFFPNPQTSPIFSGLYAGTYSIFATDANGCSDSVVVTITQPDQLVITTSSIDVGCNGGADGMAFVDTVYGGTAPYFYLWSTGATTNSISNLTVGTYTVQVTDANGCETDTTPTIIIINELPVLQSTITILSHATCEDSSSSLFASGEMSVSASGGAPVYSYLWNTIPSSASASINNLMPGIYTVTITDQNNCELSDTAEILSGENPTLAVVIENVSCFGLIDGFMTTSAIGGTPPYLFSDDGGNTFQPSSTFGPTGAQTYYITVIDSLGCTDSAAVSVTEPNLIQVSISLIQDVSCYDSANGELVAIVTGGTPGYSYLWNDPGAQTDSTATGLVFGSYSVTVTDTNNCPFSTSAPFPIAQPDSLYISALTQTAVVCNGDSTGTATVVAAGGTTPAYSYLWNDPLLQTTPTASSLVAGSYSVQISDGNECSRNSSIIVTEPNALSAAYSGDSVSCIDGSDGLATVLVSGGVFPYGYLWEHNGSTSATVNNLSAGWYTVTITDANLCVLIDSVNILDPTYPFEIDSLIITEITCHDANNGTITVLATGGHLPYMYSNTNGLNMQSNIGFINLAPNTYIIYVEDDKGCFDRDTVTFINPDSLYIDTTIFSHISCYDSANGSIQAIYAFGGTPFGGTPPYYEYSVNGGVHHANMAYFNGYPAGTYTVEVWDAHNCGAQDIIIITEPDELNVTITTSNWYFNTYQIQCHGDTSGFANITVNGGVGPYINTVLDINGDTVVSSTNSYIDSLFANTYTFIIEDANGCAYTESIIYDEPSLIEHNFIATHVSCSGWSSGSLTDVVSGGVGDATTYTYSWNTGATTYTLTSIPIGTYTMTVVDLNGCPSIDSYTINAADSLNITATGTDVSCYDYCDGIIVTNVTGGSPSYNSSGLPVYSYQWDDILLQNTATAIGLCVDNNSNSSTYSCVVTDGQGCTDTVNYTLTQADSLNVIASILNEISCNLYNDGQLTAAVTGGNGGTTYLWNNGTSFTWNPVNNNLSVGSYVVVAIDVNGCMDTTEIYLTEPSALSIAISGEIDVSCFGEDDGTIIADADGGTPILGIPPKYEYEWSHGLIETVTISNATGLAPGIYTVTATDANGCTITSQSVYITEPGNPLSISVVSVDEICGDDGTATASVSGGTTPYAYAWSNGGTTNPVNNLAPLLFYTVNVTDANGCTISGETFINGNDNILLPGYLTSIDTAVCLGTSVSLLIQVKDLLSYVWMYNNVEIFNSENSVSWDGNITVTPTGPVNVYTLYITDPNCTNPYMVTATIHLPAAPVDPLISSDPLPERIEIFDEAGVLLYDYMEAQINAGKSIDVFSNNMNCDIYEWSWRADRDTTIVQLAAQRVITDYPDATGWYYIAVDSAGCSGRDSLKVVVGIPIYDVITPNGDGANDVWNMPGIEYYPNALIQVFNRWGALVYETSGGDYIPWKGTRDGKELPIGTYYYIIDLKTGDDPQTGPITIIR